jgi:Tfp pilus assembly protein PilX
MNYTQKNQKGSVLVFSLLVLSMLLAIAVSSTILVFVTKNSARSTERSILAFQIADGAAENILKRVYKDTDVTLNTLANNLFHSGPNPTCVNGVISGVLPSSSGTYTVTLYEDEVGNKLDCGLIAAYDTYAEWRKKLLYIVATGTYGGTTRAINVGIEPCPVLLCP